MRSLVKVVAAASLVLSFALGAQASSLTTAQVQAILGLLQSFGADQATIANVQAALNGQATSGTSSSTSASCINLSYNLYPGVTDAQTSGEVSQLQQFLSISPTTGYFGRLTQTAVQNWQAAHGVVSSGSPSTTGFGAVGPATRAAMACGSDTTSGVPANQPPTPATPTTPTIPTTPAAPSVPASTSGSSNTPLIGAFRWDGWFPNVQTVYPQYYPSNFFTAWSYREPTYGWFDADTSGAQAIMDQEINDAANHGLDFWVFDDYKYMEDATQFGNQVQLYDAYKEYLASPNKSRLKFSLWISPGVTSAGGYIPNYWRSTYLPYLIKTFQDPQYLKVSGNRPVLFVGGSGSSPSDIDLNFTNWPQEHAYLNQQAEAAGLGDPVIIQTDADIATAQADGLSGVSTYGVMGNGASPSGCTNDPGNPTPHCSFSAQMTKDESNWTAEAQSGLTVVPGLTANDDPRALTHPYGFYVDQPTYTQWQQEVKDAFAFMTSNASKASTPPIAVIYAWNELGEGGPGIMPTKQNGTMFLDAIQAVKTGNYPTTYSDVYNGDNKAITLAPAPGSASQWVDYSPVVGNFNNDEEISQGIGESATLTVDNSTGFEVKGTEGPNRGKMQVFIDNVSQGTINLNSASWLQGQSLYKSGALAAGTHTLKLVNVSTNVNAAQMGIDEIIVSKQVGTVTPPPTVSFAASPTSGQAPLSVSFGGLVPANTYTLNFGDGASQSLSCQGGTSCTVNASHTYASAGTYDAVLSPMCTGTGCSSVVVGSAVITVSGATLSAPVISSFTASPGSIVAGQSSTLAWSASNATSLSISGIGSMTGTSVQVSPSQSTSYTLTATNAQGSVSAQTTVSVSQQGAGGGNSALTASPTSGRVPLSVTFTTAVPQGDTETFTVNFGDGSSGQMSVRPSGVSCTANGPCSNGSASVSHSYSASGTYTATLFNGVGTALGTAAITVTSCTTNGISC